MKSSVISRTVLILSLVSLFADIASEMLYPIIPIYLKSIGFGVVLIGLLEGIAVTTSGLMKGVFGQWSDHTGRRTPFIRLGYFIAACTKPMLAMFTPSLWIFFVRTLDRFSKGMRTTPRDALLSAEATPETKAQVFGFHRSLDTLGAVIGPLLALWYLQSHPDSLRSIFFYAFIPGMIAVAISFLVREKKAEPRPESKRPGMFSYFGYWKKAPQSYRHLILPLLLYTLFNSSDMFLLLQVREMTQSETAPVLAYVIYNIVFAASSYFLGRLADSIGKKWVVLFGIVCFALSYALITQAHEMWVVALVFCIYGLSESAVESNVKAWLSNMVSSNEVGTALGLFASLQSIAVFGASSIAGLVWHAYGPTTIFLMSSVAAMLAFLWLIIDTRSSAYPS